MSDVEIKQFMEKNHPQFKDNLTLGKLLYQKAMNKNPVVRKMGSPFEVKIKEINTLKAGTKVAIRGLIAEIEQKTYVGCTECRKKVCDHNKGTKDIIVSNLLIGDDTEMIWASVFELNPSITVGQEVEVVGNIKEWNREKSVSAFEVKPVEKTVVPTTTPVAKPEKGSKEDKIRRVVAFVEGSEKASLDMIEAMCEGEGIRISDIESYVNINSLEGYVYSKKGN
jgi:hypothetical protein